MPASRFRAALAALAASLLTACAGYSPTIGTAEKPTGKEAYLYGRFQMDAPEARLAFGGHQTMGFVFKCADQQSYTIRFERQDAIQVLKIAPSTCAMAEFVYTDADGFVKSRKPAPATLKTDVTFAAGKAYYLGDFWAQSTQTISGNIINRTWRIRDVRNDYTATTERLKAAYPNLSGLPTENRMIGR